MTTPVGPGTFVAVVGASGVGKDALIGYARERVGPGVTFPRRVITRPSGPGEDHDPVDVGRFDEACATGEFVVWWRAHGAGYGIPAAVDTAVRQGSVVVANVSRGVLDSLAAKYERLVVVRVEVSDEVRAARLRGRRREDAAQIVARLARVDPAPSSPADVVIVNDGPVAVGGEVLVRVVAGAAAG